MEKSRAAQIECQKAAVKFQRANGNKSNSIKLKTKPYFFSPQTEMHAAAKETVALAEQRFMSNSHEWQFDNAWQEMLNHATLKVMDAEKEKTETHADHQRKAVIFNTAELKLQQLEDKLRRNILKSRPYFQEKEICQHQLQTQKDRIHLLQAQVQNAKSTYSNSLKNLEIISEEIHKMRRDLRNAAPSGPREPGVGAELGSCFPDVENDSTSKHPTYYMNSSTILPVPNFNDELDKCDVRTLGHTSVATSSAVSEKDIESENDEDLDLDELRRRVKILAVRPMESGDGQQETHVWEHELNATVNKLDRLMMIHESSNSLTNTTVKLSQSPIKMLKMAEPLSLLNVSMKELPTTNSNKMTLVRSEEDEPQPQIKRKLSLQ